MGKRKRSSKSNHSGDGRNKPKRSWKDHQRIVCFDIHSNGEIEDGELLRIQGLIRCKYCETTYPRDFSECPTKSCNANT